MSHRNRGEPIHGSFNGDIGINPSGTLVLFIDGSAEPFTFNPTKQRITITGYEVISENAGPVHLFFGAVALGFPRPLADGRGTIARGTVAANGRLAGFRDPGVSTTGLALEKVAVVAPAGETDVNVTGFLINT